MVYKVGTASKALRPILHDPHDLEERPRFRCP
jgi:hypothetical protein